MRRRDQIDALRTVPLFEGLSGRELSSVAGAGRELEFRAGTAIVQEGTQGIDLYVVLAGRLQVRVRGRRRATLQAGDYFGELALLGGGPRTATVVAETDVVLHRIASDDLMPLLERTPTMALKILRGMTERLRHRERSVRS